MELQPQQQQEKDTKTLLENKEEEASSVVEVVPAKSKDSCADKPEKDDGGSAIDSAGPSSIGDPGPSSCSETTHDTSGKEEESFPSVFISHASINISGSNPDISESEKLRKATARAEIGEREGSASKGNIDSFTIPQRVVVHRVCSDSRIGEGEGFHSSKLAFYTADGSFSSSLKALGLSVNNGGSRSGSMKNKNRQKQGSSSSEQLSSKEKVNNNASAPTTSEVVKKRSQTSNKGCDPRGNGVELAGESGSGTSSNVCGGGVNKYIDILPPIEQSISESKTEHPSTSEGEETLAEDVVDDEEELLDEYDEQSKSLDCQLDFDAAVTELLLRPEKKARYKDSATWTQEDDMPSPLSDLSPVASPRRKKESNRNFHRELDRETGHSHNSLLEQYHHYLLEQQQHKQPQAHRHSRGGSGSKSGGSGSQHHHHAHHSQQHHSHQNPKSSIVGIHQGNLKSQSHAHPHHPHQSQTQVPLQAECFTVSSQLLSREAKLYENVPATQGELETLEILLASGGSGDSNYPPSGGSGSGGGASNTTASTSNTSGTSGQSHKTSSHGNNLNNNHNSNNGHHRSHHHHQQQQPHHHHHHLLHQGYVHGQHSHSATNLNTNTGNSAEQLFSVSDFLGSGGGLSVGNNNGGPPSRTSWADSGRESLSFDGENNNSTGSTRNLLLIPPPPPPPINYLASTSTAGHSGFNSSSMMHPSHHSQHHSSSKHSSHHSHHHHHHHHHSQAQASESPSHHQTHNTKRSRRERLVRQKHAIDESIFPSHGGSDKIDGGGEGTLNSNLMGVPSPRRGLLPGNMQASNFIAAAASPINLQRHPPASQIMLQENKKNGPLIPCESPYGIMAGGPGTVGTVDWPYPETFGENLRRNTNKSHLTGNILRSRSPQRGRGIGSKGNNSSFDYGELPSHQMFPKRHLLTSRQFSGHRGYSPGASGTMQNNGNSGLCPPTGFQPMQHRSFPAGVFSGATPRSCSMGDLTSSAASLNGPNGQGHHHSNHHNGKSPERLAISSNTAPVNGLQSSTVPLVTSLPLPPATSVTYEFSLAPVSGTLAPGWHLTAVQRGLATAVPLAAAVARRRLPRPRTARPRFGFTDKNEARRAKWTIVITALALLAMSMLLVGVTLRLAPLIDDLVRKENESLLQSIQPQLNSQNLTTPQPTTQTHQAQDNSIANQDNTMDKSIESLQSGQSLTRSKVTSSFDDSQSETGDEQKSNKTANSNLDISEGGGGENSTSNRSNNHVINSDNGNPSLKSNSIRPKRSRPRSKLDEVELTSSRSSSIIISVLNEKVGANDLNDTPGLAKTRHLESSIMRFLKNSNGQERRNLESASRNL
ncbi:unnamed protein product [Orchesella dallaii]|uniref:Uncharacterized protein n=1 Tax=Orchesella dallaii TaxID=48710 RepID=A0ABP1PZ10_9HEXA